MRKIIFLFISVLFQLFSFAQENISIIPEPVKIMKTQGHFILPASISIKADDDPALKTSLTELTNRLTIPTGCRVTETNSGSAMINITLNRTANPELGSEGYQLTVTEKNIHITANQPAGIFYAVQTFLQLLPPEIESNTAVKGITWSAPCVSSHRLSAIRMARTDAGREPSFFYKRRSKELYDPDGSVINTMCSICI